MDFILQEFSSIVKEVDNINQFNMNKIYSNNSSIEHESKSEFDKNIQELYEKLKILFKNFSETINHENIEKTYELLLTCKDSVTALSKNIHHNYKEVCDLMNFLQNFEQSIIMTLICDNKLYQTKDNFRYTISTKHFTNSQIHHFIKLCIIHNSKKWLSLFINSSQYDTHNNDDYLTDCAQNNGDCVDILLSSSKYSYYHLSSGLINNIIMISILNKNTVCLESIIKYNKTEFGSFNLDKFILLCNEYTDTETDIGLYTIPEKNLPGCLEVSKLLFSTNTLKIEHCCRKHIIKYLHPNNLEFIKLLITYRPFMKLMLINNTYNENLSRNNNPELYNYLDTHNFNYNNSFKYFQFENIKQAVNYLIELNIFELTITNEPPEIKDMSLEESKLKILDVAIDFLRNKNVHNILVTRSYPSYKYTISYKKEYGMV